MAQLFRALARISLGLALVVVLFTASAAPSNAQPAEPNQITTVLFVRHADAEDGLLTEDGELRAEQLVQVLEKANVKAIFVTNRERSLQTAQPLIEKFQPQLKATTYKYQGKRKKI
ncbi:MAG: histidine phosphatase family protein [Xenococcus sp. (in: cyanobacteria)]